MEKKNIINVEPCPICGENPIIDINLDGFDEVRCLKCGIYIESYSRESAIKIWNESDLSDLLL